MKVKKLHRQAIAWLLTFALILCSMGTNVMTVWAAEPAAGTATASDAKATAANAPRIMKAPRAGGEESGNLNDFLKRGTITIGGKSQSLDSPITVTENTNYEVLLYFAESRTAQFATELTYTFPEGFDAQDRSGTFDMTVGDGEKNYTVHADYAISGGSLQVSFEEEDNESDAWAALQAAANAQFEIQLSGKIKTGTTSLAWSGSTSTSVTVNPEEHALSIEKHGSFDAKTNKVNYTVTVTSTGTNTDVTVTDAIKGTALKLDTAAVEAKPDTGTFTKKETPGFTYVIPSMADGDKVVITYSADVDRTKVTGNGTKAETENTAAVTSKEQKQPAMDGHDLENQITYSSLKKKASVSDGENNHKTVSWTVKYNTEKLLSMGGRTLTDTIDADSQSIMKYSGTGITVKVTDEDGKEVRTDVIAWNALQGKSDTSWTYQIPSSDAAAYEYEITYTTDVDASGLNTTKRVKNEIADSEQNKSSDEAKIEPSEGNKVDVSKEAVSVSMEEIQWKITLQIPSGGVTEDAYVYDSLPSVKIGDETVRDELVEESFQVTGLLEGETYTHGLGEDGKDFNFRFYPDESKTSAGLRGSGSPREVVITYTTKNNAKWLAAAESNPKNYQKHKNEVKFRANGSTPESSDYGIPAVPGILKTVKALGKDSDGLPMYAYFVTVTGLSGDLDITDTFDTDVLEYTDEYTEKFDDVRAGHVYGSELDGKYYDSDQTAMITETAGGIRIHMDEAQLAVTKSDKKRYTRYTAVYVLKVKNADVLETLNAKAIASETGSTPITNTAAAGDFTPATATVNYRYESIKKELVSTTVPTDGSRPYATYQIVVNPEGRDLDAESDTLTLQDKHSDSLSVNRASIVTDPAEGVTYDIDGNTVTFKVPDSKKVTITYNAWIVGTGEVNISNSASLLGFTAAAPDQVVEIANRGSGSASIYSINLYKYKAGDMNTALSGAIFELYEVDAQTGEGTAVKNSDGKTASFTTDETGSVRVMGRQNTDGWTLYKDTAYYLVETKAPEGYTASTQRYSFTISDQPDYKNAVYIDGDTINIRNTPVGPEKPDTPATPSEPEKPDTPATPSNPDKPDTPATPSNPDKPDTPATPSNPDKPDTPATPSNPDKPNTPGGDGGNSGGGGSHSGGHSSGGGGSHSGGSGNSGTSGPGVSDGSGIPVTDFSTPEAKTTDSDTSTAESSTPKASKTGVSAPGTGTGKKITSVPKTGDNSITGLWSAVSILSLLGIAVLTIRKKREENR